MNEKEAIMKLYEQWQEWHNDHYAKPESLDTYFNEQQKKRIFLSDAIIGIVTYDDELSADYGNMILNTLIQIKNKTTLEYIKDRNNYKNYIISCNFICDWLYWGTSIRTAWFNTFDGKITPNEYLGNTGYNSDYISITVDFMNWFIDWLSQ